VSGVEEEATGEEVLGVKEVADGEEEVSGGDKPA
jgi:hypothetical protein